MRTGRQVPTFKQVGKYAYSLCDEVAEMFAEDGGATFYPAQLYELELMLARNKNGSPAARAIGISRPRQNGKSYAARYYAAYMAVFEHRSVLYSAHHSSTTKKMFKELCTLFESPERYPDFAADVKNISHARGYEGFYFNDWMDADGNIQTGGCIEFATRTNSGARGGTYSVIIIDEAQELTSDEQEAMLPTVSAASNVEDEDKMPQQIYVGTPPGPACRGTVFRKMHDDAHQGKKSSVWWLEWGIQAKDIFTYIPDKRTAIRLAYKTNPAMGYRIAEKTVETEFSAMRLDGFARERLGWWSSVVEKEVIDYALDHEAWAQCASMERKPEGKTAYGVKFSPDGTTVVLAGAVITPDGRSRISLIDVQPAAFGTRWLADWLNQRYEQASCVVIDGKNGADLLIDRITDVWKYKGSVVKPKANDVINACTLLTSGVNEGTLTWYKPQDALNDSAVNAVKRPIYGGWGFGGENSALIEACALALWGAKNSRRVPGRKMRIG